VLSIASNRSAAPAATWEDEIKTKYHTDNSWRYEMEHFFTAIENNSEIKIGNSADALRLMQVIDKIYNA
jgi:1,5-anhydro-D-fructose reductase (1,5-anhydro-D-mannitol-forming)